MIALLVIAGFTGFKASTPGGVAAPSGSTGASVFPKRHATGVEISVAACSGAKKGLRWYVRWALHWRAERGADDTHRTAELKSPGEPGLGRLGVRSRCPLYLAKVWRAKARAERKAYVKWWGDVGRVVTLLERGLRGTPMSGTGALLEKWGRRYGVSPYFMVATAATESSIGHASCSNNPKNVWGLASCVNSWPVPYFETWDEAISFYAKFLAERWRGHSTPYSFRGYAACSDCWGRKVSWWMGRLFGVAASTRYP